MSNDEFLIAFRTCTLPAAEWTHEAHLRMAWLVLKRANYEDALDEIRAGITRFNDRVLKKVLAYHETITVAFTRLIAVGMSDLPNDHTFGQFKVSFPDFFDNKLSALLKHYNRETLFSDEARARYIEPDLVKLPSFPG